MADTQRRRWREAGIGSNGMAPKRKRSGSPTARNAGTGLRCCTDVDSLVPCSGRPQQSAPEGGIHIVDGWGKSHRKMRAAVKTAVASTLPEEFGAAVLRWALNGASRRWGCKIASLPCRSMTRRRPLVAAADSRGRPFEGRSNGSRLTCRPAMLPRCSSIATSRSPVPRCRGRRAAAGDGNFGCRWRGRRSRPRPSCRCARHRPGRSPRSIRPPHRPRRNRCPSSGPGCSARRSPSASRPSAASARSSLGPASHCLA